jgi:hypothetical protein
VEARPIHRLVIKASRNIRTVKTFANQRREKPFGGKVMMGSLPKEAMKINRKGPRRNR